MLGHAQHDAQKYVPPHELETWRERDPIARLETLLTDGGHATADDLADVRASVAAELDAAVDDVLAEPDPPAAEARSRVYEDGSLDAEVPWTRRAVPGYENLAPGAGAA
jgi:TPP-dependent pyruvate/acetoin dehydrogenase alpha subunit